MGRVQRPIGINVVMNQTPPSYTENADLVFFSLSLLGSFFSYSFVYFQLSGALFELLNAIEG